MHEPYHIFDCYLSRKRKDIIKSLSGKLSSMEFSNISGEWKVYGFSFGPFPSQEGNSHYIFVTWGRLSQDHKRIKLSVEKYSTLLYKNQEAEKEEVINWCNSRNIGKEIFTTFLTSSDEFGRYLTKEYLLPLFD